MSKQTLKSEGRGSYGYGLDLSRCNAFSIVEYQDKPIRKLYYHTHTHELERVRILC